MQFNPNNLETDWNPSFFNLEIELLIEGMSGVLDCSQYKFHSERGYGNTYFTNVSMNFVQMMKLHLYPCVRTSPSLPNKLFWLSPVGNDAIRSVRCRSILQGRSRTS